MSWEHRIQMLRFANYGFRALLDAIRAGNLYLGEKSESEISSLYYLNLSHSSASLHLE